jgi:major membrane immunogen (membrane-anchored lipoprotein)
MKKMARVGVAIILLLALTGCSSHWGSAGLGAVGGAAVGVGGQEYHLKKEKDRIEQDYKDGKIDKREYEIRIDQNRRDSVF